MQVLAFPASRIQAEGMAAILGVPCSPVEVHRFPDGESRVRLPLDLPDDLVFFCSLDHPNDKLVELMLAASEARRQGVRRLTLVAPYLCYMRQDKAFNPGEAVSQRVVGRWLADAFDRLVTVDPHLHRVHRLEEAVPVVEASVVSAAAAMGDYLARQQERLLLLGPDEESAQWVAAVAAKGGLDYGVARKERRGDRDVRVALPDLEFSGRTLVLVDDMAATGRTLAEAARRLRERGCAEVRVLVTHPLFVGDAEAQLRAAGVSRICSTDSVSHSSNVIFLAPLLAAALVDGAAWEP